MMNSQLYTNLLSMEGLDHLPKGLISLRRIKNCFCVSAFDASIRFSNSCSLMGKGEEIGFDGVVGIQV